jgi:hypothetical protein
MHPHDQLAPDLRDALWLSPTLYESDAHRVGSDMRHGGSVSHGELTQLGNIYIYDPK